jgi:ribokinase
LSSDPRGVRSPHIVVVGDLVTDTVAVHTHPLAVGSDTPARISVTGGGSAANTAAWLAWLGVAVTFVGVVGDDEAGAARVAELTRAGVRPAVRRCPGRSTGAVVVLATADERTMLVDRGANAALTAADVTAHLDRADHLHVSGYTLLDPGTREAARTALASARAKGATTSVDAASAAPLRLVGGASFISWVRPEGLLLTNLAEAAALLDRPGGDADTLGRSLATEVASVVVKQGSAGAVWASGETLVAAPAHPATAVDPTGAGDAFAAGLLDARLGGADPFTALDAGARTAARAVSLPGGRPR